MKKVAFRKNAGSGIKKTASGLKIIFICLNLFVLIFAMFFLIINGQEDVKRDVAVITDSAGNKRIIKYSDVLIQLALQPDSPPLNPPRSEDLKRVLQNMINLSLIGSEVQAWRVSCPMPTRAELDEEIRRMSNLFPSTAEFEKRLRIAGFDSIKNEDFERLMAALTAIQKCLDFRFRSFVVITLEEEETYYRDVFAPAFRRRNLGILMSDLQKQRSQIRQILTEQKAVSEIKRFLDNAKQRAKIVILSDDWKF